jgi:hypothetical protein
MIRWISMLHFSITGMMNKPRSYEPTFATVRGDKRSTRYLLVAVWMGTTSAENKQIPDFCIG